MYTATGSTDSRLKPTHKTGLFLAQNAKSKKSGLALAKWAATWLIWGMNHFQKQSQRCITSTMKLHPAPLWPGWNLSSHYQQAARSKQHGGSTVTAVVGVAAPAAPTSADPPTYTPAEQSPYHSSLFPIKMSAKSQESHGAESPAGLGRSRAGCTGKHGGPEALIKMAMTPLRRTHTHAFSYTPSRAWVYQPLRLEYISRPRCRLYWRCLLGAHCSLWKLMWGETGSEKVTVGQHGDKSTTIRGDLQQEANSCHHPHSLSY